jgi:hypothetical protein
VSSSLMSSGARTRKEDKNECLVIGSRFGESSKFNGVQWGSMGFDQVRLHACRVHAHVDGTLHMCDMSFAWS